MNARTRIAAIVLPLLALLAAIPASEALPAALSRARHGASSPSEAGAPATYGSASGASQATWAGTGSAAGDGVEVAGVRRAGYRPGIGQVSTSALMRNDSLHPPAATPAAATPQAPLPMPTPTVAVALPRPAAVALAGRVDSGGAPLSSWALAVGLSAGSIILAAIARRPAA